jgi:purine-binding chemotaxis protein CheW
MTPRRRAPVDWQQIRRRLAETERALSRGVDTDPAERRAILDRRARALGAPVPPVPRRGTGIDVVEFMLAEQRHAIEASFVHEVLSLKELTGVPCTPAFVSGIINAHGRIIAVIDLKRFFEWAESGLSDLNKVVILQHRDVAFGILADSIVGTRWLSLADLQAVPPGLVGRRDHCVRGITPQRTLVLDAGRLLADPALVIDEEVAP